MTLGRPSDVSVVGRAGHEVWSYHFQNIECQWFQVPFGSDGRTSGRRLAHDDPGLHERVERPLARPWHAARRRPRLQFQNGPPTQLVVAMPSSMLP